ncbi:MAG: thioesterase family protein, partial [Comamonas sp.]
MSHTPDVPTAFEPEFIAAMRQLTEELISFHKVLGLQLVSVTPQEAQARMVMKPELVGHFGYNRIHGGAISAALDAMGGVA